MATVPTTPRRAMIHDDDAKMKFAESGKLSTSLKAIIALSVVLAVVLVAFFVLTLL